MCGISAIFTNHTLPSMQECIFKMTTVIQHRGPDDEGFVFMSPQKAIPVGGKDTPSHVFGAPYAYCPPVKELGDFSACAAFGHRRLAILDLSPSGHQPMCTADSQIWITYNGEIYNYLEIRTELEKLGCVFRTQSDTEVIIQAYQQWGKEALSKFNGMFAFVIYDRGTQKALAVRDRFGVKPLYYWRSPQGFLAFASEIKQFTVLPGWDPLLQGQMAYDFLNWGLLDHTSETFFDGIRQLRGGEFLEFEMDQLERGTLSPQKWYELPQVHYRGSFAEATERFAQLMEDAVRLRLRADVPVGSCLSGGLDSSTIVCLMNKILAEKPGSYTQNTFSACSDVARFDEKKFIDLVVNQADVHPHFTTPSPEQLLNDCEQLVWHQDTPFNSTSIYAQWEVFKLVKAQKIKVMLDGQGADEQLAGYHGFFGNRFWDLWQSLRWKTLYDEIKLTKELHPHIQPLSLLFNKLTPNRLRQPLRKLLGKSSTRPDWLNLSLLTVCDRDPFYKRKNKTVFHQSQQQLMHSSLPMLLHFEDRDSMAHSVESRTPFLDYRLVEFTLNLSSDYKIQKGWTKRILRESMKNLLPREIHQRTDKLAFVTAEEEWMKTPAFAQAFKHAVESSRGLFNHKASELYQKIRTGERPFSYLPWRIMSFSTWMNRFNVKIN